jgi:CRP-like cAMP-binding protein
MIVVKGELELVVEHNTFDFHLDVLGVGSVLGTYSILNESFWQFSGRAKSTLSLLTLDRDELIEIADKHEEMTDGIEEATQFIIDSEVPICDFTINPYSGGHLPKKRTAVEKFRTAVHRLRALNRRK